MATALLITASVAAFATLGDGGKKGSSKATVPASKKLSSKNFSLRSGYNYKANNILADRPSRFIMMNTSVTFQKGNSTYILPVKKKVFLDKIKFNPTPVKF